MPAEQEADLQDFRSECPHTLFQWRYRWQSREWFRVCDCCGVGF